MTAKLIKTDDGSTMTIPEMLKSIERYNPVHYKFLEEYVEEQAKENTYDLDANLAVLKFYQFNPNSMNLPITHTILLKALTNLPNTDFVLCKCLLLPAQMKDDTVKEIIYIADILEQCDFALFWSTVEKKEDLFKEVSGFYDAVRKFVCHVIGTTFQTIDKLYLSKLLGNIDDKSLSNWVKRNNWIQQGETITVKQQEDTIKTKHIAEKIDFESLGGLMANCL
ncbi:unnamed protein product [Diamesa serratosioi]